MMKKSGQNLQSKKRKDSMAEKKLTIYLKTKPASMEHLCKTDINCDFCEFYNDKSHPKCFEDKNCIIYEYIKDKTKSSSTDVEFDTNKPNNPEINIVTKDTDSLYKIHDIAKRAVEIALGDVINQKQK